MRRALNSAILKGSTACVKILFNERIQPAPYFVGVAVKHGYKDLLDFFLRTCTNAYELNYGLIVAVRINDIPVVKRLLQSRWRPDGPDIPGADVNMGVGGLLPLDIAVKKGYVEMARLLVEHGAKPGSGYMSGTMEKAAVEGDMAIIKFFSELGMTDGFYLRLASFHGQEEVVDYFLRINVDVNSKAATGRTALMCAAIRGRQNIVRLLMEHGADVNAMFKADEQQRGHTALMWAVCGNHEVVVDMLLRAGAKVDVKSRNDETAYDMAVRNRFGSIVKRLNMAKRTSLIRTKPTKLRLKRRAVDAVGRNRFPKRRRRGIR